MGKLKWYKRDPDAALSGMMMLTLEERGAFNTVLDLLYTRAGDLPDDDRFLAGWMRCDVRVWKRIKIRLIDLGKLTVKDGMLSNIRATSEILTALSRVASAREAGLISAAKSQAKSNENNEMASTPVQRYPQPYNNHNQNKKEKEESKSRDATPKASRFALTSPPDEWIDFCKNERPDLDPMKTFANFTDHWKAKPGKDGCKLDWLATWRVWVRNERSSLPRPNQFQKPQPLKSNLTKF